MISGDKICSNPDCSVENPQFYPSRHLCTLCFNRSCAKRRKKKRKGNTITEKNKIIEDLQETIQLLSEKLSGLQV